MVSFLATSSRLVSGFLPLCPSQKSTGPNNPLLEKCSDAKVLGTTATPIRYLDGERDMSDELFDEEAVNLSLAEAIQRNILAADKIKRLDELGFVWGADQQFWEDRYQELTTYRQEHGDCSVPYNWGNKQLAAWVRNQRTLKKGGKLYADKIKRLDELGFVWDAASPT